MFKNSDPPAEDAVEQASADGSRRTIINDLRGSIMGDEAAEKKVSVGHGVTISGEITGADEVKIDGKADIVLETTKLVVGNGGWLKGEITCMDADIRGQLEGKINVTNTLAIQEKGTVSGDINYKQLQVALGGQLAGNLQSGDVDSKGKPASKPKAATGSAEKPILLDSNKGSS